MANISVIIPCYNAEKMIRETIESVLAQTYQDFEIIVVDDGSTDHSKEIIQSFGEKVKYIYQENGGQSAARNTAIRASNGKYLAFVDADDLWFPEKLEKQLKRMNETGVDWCFCDCEIFVDETKNIVGVYSQLVYPPQTGNVAVDLLMGNFIASPTPIVSKKIFEKAGYFDESPEIRSGEDWEEWVRITIISKVEYVAETLARYRVHSASVTNNEDPEKVYYSHVAAVNKLCDQFPEELGNFRKDALSNYAEIFSKMYYLQREYTSAKQYIKKAHQANPKIRYWVLALLYSLPAFINNWILNIRSRFRGKR